MFIRLETYALKTPKTGIKRKDQSLRLSLYESAREGGKITCRQVVHLGTIQVWQLLDTPSRRDAFLKQVQKKLNKYPDRVKLIRQFNQKIGKYAPKAQILGEES
jgi:hypothetical protein